MHPDVWAHTDAERWHYYSQLFAAYQDGREEVKHRRGNKAEADRKHKEFIKQHTG